MSDLDKQIEEAAVAKAKALGIKMTPGYKQELSGLANGEDRVMANSLVTTTPGTGAYQELPRLDDEFKREVLEEIQSM